MRRSPNTPPFAFPAPTRAPARTHRTLFVPPTAQGRKGPRPGPNSLASPAAFPR